MKGTTSKIKTSNKQKKEDRRSFEERGQCRALRFQFSVYSKLYLRHKQQSPHNRRQASQLCVETSNTLQRTTGGQLES